MRVGGLFVFLCLGACAPMQGIPVVTATRASHRTMAARQTIVAPDPGALTESYLRCADDRCPEGVGMLLWRGPGDEGLQSCTASLISPDLVLTASHCLPEASRHEGASCSGVWMTFARSPRLPREWVACAAVLHATDSPEETVMETDLAVLRLEHRLDRGPLLLAPVPTEPGVIVSVVAVRPHPIYPSQNELSTRLCRVATAQSAVEEFGARAAQVGWLIDCPSRPGNSGSPVLDHRGRIRSVLHGGSGPVDRIAITSRIDGPSAAAAASP